MAEKLDKQKTSRAGIQIPHPQSLVEQTSMSAINRQKPGASFAFVPGSNIASKQMPTFAGPPSENRLAHSGLERRGDSDAGALRELSIMVNERAPPKQAAPPSSKDKAAPDFDDDYDKLHSALGSIKSSALKGLDTTRLGAGRAISQPGHKQQMMSSRKQKADIFIHQKSRPEHHLGSTQISGPRPPTYQDRKAPPLPLFTSIVPSTTKPTYADEVFYTDATKANADLKALLEGGMDDEDNEVDEEDDERKGVERTEPSRPQSQASRAEPSQTTVRQETMLPPKAPNAKKPSPVGRDGTVQGIRVKLLPHQVEGVQWMRGRELGPVKRGKVPKGGLLADDMGLGKTLQSVSLVVTNRKPEREAPGWKKHFEDLEKTTLVVAPLALLKQWEQEMKDKVEESLGLKVLVHHGPQRTKDSREMAKYDVVVTTFQILVSEHGSSKEGEDGVKVGCFGLRWWRVILDEAHSIKNRNAKSTKACYALRSEYRWCLSGTPMQNNLDELQSLVRFLRISPYDNYQQWREHIDQPMKNGQGHIAIRRLHSLLRCFMKRRTKEILKKDGALNPGGKPSGEGEPPSTGFKHTERKVITVPAEMSPAERKFYDRLEARADQSLEAMLRDGVSYASAFTLLLRLRQTCNHPKLVEGKLDKDKDALYTGSSQKSQDLDLNAVADMFAGMNITKKSCSICGRQLNLDDTTLASDHCAECHEDLESFKDPEQALKGKLKKMSRKASKKSKGKQGIKSSKTKHSKTPQRARRQRNRNAILDSDDEEADGSWLVPEDERGDVNLGKAGGEEDENAEGGGDWVGSEDSAEDDDEPDQSNLNSFVVSDETARKEKGYQSLDEATGDDSLLSVDALTLAMASQTLGDNSSQPRGSPASMSGSTSGEDDDDTSDSDASDTELYSSGGEDGEDDGEERNSVWLTGQGTKASRVVASAKIRALSKILRDEVEQHKFIVFSQFTSMLDLVEPFLEKDGFKYVRYDGSMRNENREESLRSLREDAKTRILLCSLKCGSLGLNLTAATRVIIVEPFWNPFVEEQAIDRVHRLTQTVDVVVYKLTVAKTVEERIIDLQNRKRELAEQTIEGGAKKQALKLGINEMIDLFKPGGGHQELKAPPGPLANPERPASGAGVLRRKPAGREESAVFGRRW